MTMHPKTHDRLHDLFVYLFFFSRKKKGELFCHIPGGVVTYEFNFTSNNDDDFVKIIC